MITFYRRLEFINSVNNNKIYFEGNCFISKISEVTKIYTV